MRLEPDAVCAITRDYLADPTRGTRTVWHIEADRSAADLRASDEPTWSRGLRAAHRRGSASRPASCR